MKHAYSKTELMKMLADAGIRPSVQRLAILEYVSADKCHPTADEIYANLVKGFLQRKVWSTISTYCLIPPDTTRLPILLMPISCAGDVIVFSTFL